MNRIDKGGRRNGVPSVAGGSSDAVCFTAGTEVAAFGAGTIHAYLAADRKAPVVAAGISMGAVVAAAMRRCYMELATSGTESSRWAWLRRYLDVLCNDALAPLWEGLPDPSDFFSDHPPIADPATPDHLKRGENAALTQRYKLVNLGRWLAHSPIPVGHVARVAVAYVRRHENYPSPFAVRWLTYQGLRFALLVELLAHLARKPLFHRPPTLHEVPPQPGGEPGVPSQRRSAFTLPRPLFGYLLWGGAAAIWWLLVAAVLSLILCLVTVSVPSIPFLEAISWGKVCLACLLIPGLSFVAMSFPRVLAGIQRRIVCELGLDQNLIHNFYLHNRLESLFGHDAVPNPDSPGEAPSLVLVAAALQTLKAGERTCNARQLYAKPGALLREVLATALSLPGLFEPTKLSKDQSAWRLPDGVQANGQQLIDGAAIRRNPLPAFFRYLRDHPALAQQLTGTERPSVHVVYSVPTEPRPMRPKVPHTALPAVDVGAAEMPDAEPNVVDVGVAALRLNRRRDTQMEVQQANFLSRLSKLLPSEGKRADATLCIGVDEIAPAADDPSLGTLGWTRAQARANVRAGCKRTLQVLYAKEIGTSGQSCADLIRSIAPRRAGLWQGKPGIPEVCRDCDGQLAAKIVNAPPAQAVAERPRERFPQLLRQKPKQPRIVLVASGGVFRGSFHAGLAAALWTAKVKPDLVVSASVGTLMGGVVAAMFQEEPKAAHARLSELVETLLAVDRRVALTKTFKTAAREIGLRARAIDLSPADLRRAVLRGSRADAGFAAAGAPPVLIDAISELFLIPHAQTIEVAQVFVAGQITKAIETFGALLKRETLGRLGVKTALLDASLLASVARKLLVVNGKPESQRQPYMKRNGSQTDIAFFATATDLGNESLFWLGDADHLPDSHYDFVEAALASSAFPCVFAPRRESDVYPGTGAEARRFSDGGMFDNLPFLGAIQLLADNQEAGGEGRALTELMNDRLEYPDLLLAGALDVNPTVENVQYDDLVQVVNRGLSLQKNVKIRSFEKLSERCARVFGRVAEDIGTHHPKLAPEDDKLLRRVVNAAVLPVFPHAASHMNPTFAFCASLGLKRERVALSIAHGCFQTLRTLASDCPPEQQLAQHALTGLRQNGRVATFVHTTSLDVASPTTKCPYYRLPGSEGDLLDCPFGGLGSGGQDVRTQCVKDPTHRVLWAGTVKKPEHSASPPRPGAQPATRPIIALAARRANAIQAMPTQPNATDSNVPPIDSPKTVSRGTLWSVFWNTVALSIVPFALLMGYLFLWPVELDPARWAAGYNPDLSGPYVSNDELTRARLLSVQWVEPARRESQRYLGMGPETVAEHGGWLYTGLCDGERDSTGEEPPHCKAVADAQGWVVRVHPKTHQVERYVQTGGRPLGLAFDKVGRLYIADGTRGLLRVDAPVDGQHAASGAYADGSAHAAPALYARRVATCQVSGDDQALPRTLPREQREPDRVRSEEQPGRVPGPQPHYTDSVAIWRDPVSCKEEVWFTCPSQRWPLDEIRSDALESVATGRVLRYEPCDDPDPQACDTELVADGLMFANGLAVSKKADKVWVSEWYGYRIVELTPATANARGGPWSQRTFVDNLPGYPDNLTLEDDGTLWVGLVIRRLPIVDRFHPHEHLKRTLARLPGSTVVSPHAFAIALDPSGRVVNNLQDTTGFFDQVTGVYPVGSELYFASNTATALAWLPRPGRAPAPAPDRCGPWSGGPLL